MIELGLSRVARLLENSRLPWRAIHVAGTNGKGSVCAYASAMLHASHIACGRFTSPHLVDRWDCITVNEQVVDQHVFLETEARVKAWDHAHDIRATEFEILTATAFQIFDRAAIEVGVIEVGLGGREDATNILRDPLAVVLTKIGIDHQGFLGNSLREIAYHKAGILKKKTHIFVDGSNSCDALRVVRRQARDVGAGPLLLVPQDLAQQTQDALWNRLLPTNYEEHQRMHILLAYEAVKHAITDLQGAVDSASLINAVQRTTWPGRLQSIDAKVLTGCSRPLLVDGAHNHQSARLLGSYVDRNCRTKSPTITWLIGISVGKDVRSLLSCLLRPGDNVIAYQFGSVEGMPWVRSTETSSILREARSLVSLTSAFASKGNVGDAIRLASRLSEGGQIVVAGSLYLISDLFRLLRGSTE